ncbi:MAG: hypothetical protein H6738_05525 [Alphaproteobacteria bacterium]|nr:hypothetical protein [Alphaproteobacteria bacterium]MCB9696228.1 hypothetical protein [Alphaproteobacteria bacterium]
MQTPLERAVARMRTWQHLPGWHPAEHARTLFEIYLPEIVEAQLGTPLSDVVIPQLPVRNGLVWRASQGNAARRVDLVLFTADRQRVIAVDLGDGEPENARQQRMLSRLPAVGFRKVLEGVLELARTAPDRRRYAHLLQALADEGCLELPADFHDQLWPRTRRTYRRALDRVQITVAPGERLLSVLRVRPSCEGACLDYSAMRDHLERRADDPVGQGFAELLGAWIQRPGSVSAAAR